MGYTVRNVQGADHVVGHMSNTGTGETSGLVGANRLVGGHGLTLPRASLSGWFSPETETETENNCNAHHALHASSPDVL